MTNHRYDKNELIQFKKEVDAELFRILEWWIHYSKSESNKAFYGHVDNFNKPDKTAPISLVLISRLLWTFSSAYKYLRYPSYLNFANDVYEYLIENFYDATHSGMYWSIFPDGSVNSSIKKAYGNAFSLYGLAAYYDISKNNDVMDLCIELFETIENQFKDKEYSGYIESLARDWSTIEDVRLSEKDQNAIKSMNTHMHILEAYTQLHSISKSEKVKESIGQLLTLFEKNIIDPSSFQQHLFFNNNWDIISTQISYGHDIEAAWILYEASKEIKDKSKITTFEVMAVSMSNIVAETTSPDGAIYNEFDKHTGKISYDIDWWPQAEAMVGFFNAYQISGDNYFLKKSIASWNLIKSKFVDTENGEWFWGYTNEGVLLNREKAGFWKCPYHNSRSCMEISRRINLLLMQ
jgi:mannobiose 2-epimerase